MTNISKVAIRGDKKSDKALKASNEARVERLRVAPIVDAAEIEAVKAAKAAKASERAKELEAIEQAKDVQATKLAKESLARDVIAAKRAKVTAQIEAEEKLLASSDARKKHFLTLPEQAQALAGSVLERVRESLAKKNAQTDKYGIVRVLLANAFASKLAKDTSDSSRKVFKFITEPVFKALFSNDKQLKRLTIGIEAGYVHGIFCVFFSVKAVKITEQNKTQQAHTEDEGYKDAFAVTKLALASTVDGIARRDGLSVSRAKKTVLDNLEVDFIQGLQNQNFDGVLTVKIQNLENAVKPDFTFAVSGHSTLSSATLTKEDVTQITSWLDILKGFKSAKVIPTSESEVKHASA